MINIFHTSGLEIIVPGKKILLFDPESGRMFIAIYIPDKSTPKESYVFEIFTLPEGGRMYLKFSHPTIFEFEEPKLLTGH